MTLRSIMKSLALSAALFAVCSPARAQGIACSYEIAHVIQTPPCGDIAQPTFGLAISPGGRWVVGYHCACVCISDRAFVFDTTTGVFTTLPLPAGMSTSLAYDVNDAGLVVGHMGGTPGDFGFVYHIASGQYTLLPPAIAQDGTCSASGINASGVVSGTRTIGGPPGYPTNAFIWGEKSGFTDLGVMNGPHSNASDISDEGTVVGWTGAGISSNATRAFVWRRGTNTILPPVPGGLSSLAHAISPNGEFVAVTGRTPPNGYRRPFLWLDDATFVEIGVLPDSDIGFVEDVNSNGMAVGLSRSLSPGAVDRAVDWGGGVLRDLNLVVAEPQFYHLSSANTVNQAGVIVVGAVNSKGENVALTLQPNLVVGDAHPDCHVDIDDLLTVVRWWGPGMSPGDLTGDGVTDIADLLLVIDNWAR